MIEQVYRAAFTARDPAAVSYVFAGERRGPFGSRERALEDLLETVSVWHAEAQKFGGSVWMPSPIEVAVSLPMDSPVADRVLRWPRRRE